MIKFFKKTVTLFQDRPIHFVQSRISRRNAQLLLKLVLSLIVVVIIHSIFFHLIMMWEGQTHSLISGPYWTITTMTLLGFGDIIFKTDLGKIFTIWVVITGILFLLILIPFTIVRLFQSSARAPKELPANFKNHVIITHTDTVSFSLINKLNYYKIPYVIITPDLNETLDLMDNGFRVVHGNLDDPDTYSSVNATSAAMIASTGTDASNTSLIYAVRSIADKVPIVATTLNTSTAEILKIAGCTEALALSELLGQSLARRIIGGDAMAHIIGDIDGIFIAEATVTGTPITGKTLKEVRLRDITGTTVIGVWNKGNFETATPDTFLTSQTALVLAGSKGQIELYNEMFCIYNNATDPVIIIGAGEVGTTLSQALDERIVNYNIIDKLPVSKNMDKNYIQADATKRQTLLDAGIKNAPAVAITTHDDSINLYLTTLCRFLNPDIQIISRATKERSVPLLHNAGADFVMSYSSMGANSFFNYLQSGKILMVTEGVDVFKVKLPGSLNGKTIKNTTIRQDCGCSIIGVTLDQKIVINPDPDYKLEGGSEIVLIGTVESELKFLKQYNV
jgi:voltage-gated potassium channel